jgi:hypothetical protein
VGEAGEGGCAAEKSVYLRSCRSQADSLSLSLSLSLSVLSGHLGFGKISDRPRI